MSRKKTHEEYVAEVTQINPNIEVVGKYINSHTRIEFKCRVCGHRWFAKPYGILIGYGCPKCARVLRHTQEEYELRVKESNPNIEVLGQYINMNTKILHRCKICRYEWEAKPSDVVKGHGCPVCTGKTIGNPPEYQNSIWSSAYRDYFTRYMTEDQMKSYMPQSHKAAELICPDCGRPKRMSPNALYRNGFGCICGDGISYPNKFVYSMLNQLKIEIIIEYKPRWANKRRYDIYIPHLNCIIENHGAQHYTNAFKSFGTMLEIEKQNDKYKEDLALINGIDNYIIVDCRYSNKEWIKNSILNSPLLNLIGFRDDDINWDLCDEFATSNLVKSVAELWNDGLCPLQIINKMNLSRSTIYNYLKKASELSICNYSKEISKRRTREYKENTEIKEVC